MSANTRSASVKVGILTVVSIALLVFVLIWLRGRGIGGKTYSVLFPDVAGMREGASVQMMGIRVGFVDTIRPVVKNGKYYVQVNFNINENSGADIPEGSTLSIEQSGIIGEQFLEITPPRLREVTLTTFREPANEVVRGIPVKFLYSEGPLTVGAVERVEKVTDATLVRHTLYYRITRPGAVMPEHPVYELMMDPSDFSYYLRIMPQDMALVSQPNGDLQFTIEEPMRMKRFMEIQMASAEALKRTNEKINQLLSDDTIDTLNSTLKNTEVLTATATEVLDNANRLFETSGRDLERLVEASQILADNVTLVSRNVNDIIGDPKLKQDIHSTVASIEQSTAALNSILNDGAIQETLAMTRQTSQDASELVAYLRKTAEDQQLQERLDTSLTLMNESLSKLNVVLDDVQEITGDEDETLKGILKDAKATSENLRELSDRLNGRFTLFRLMF